MMSVTSPAEHDSFHTQHAPLGAFSSFTVGLVGSPGGFGHALRGPARQNVYVGYKSADSGPWRLLPFFTPPQSAEVAFTGEAAVVRPSNEYAAMSADDYERVLGWASDTWRTRDGRFGFSILSPFGETKDPARMNKREARAAFSPHVAAWIEFDNTAGSADAELMFGVGDSDRLFRPLQDEDAKLLGFACNRDFGYATMPGRGIEARQGFDVFTPRFLDHRGLLLIGGESALVFRVPAGKKKRFPLVLAFFQGGLVTSGIDAVYAYTRWFTDLEDVLRHGLAVRKERERVAAQRDRELARSGLSEDQRFLIAQATHSYFGNSQLLWGKNGPIWVVNEGEYRMMNTFDLAVDQMFFELRWFPWAVRNILDLFASRYVYRDRIKLVDGRTAPGGVSFTHDMGVMNNFTPPGRSSYECDGLTGCFSHMTMEQLLNWVLTAVTYGVSTGDAGWLRRRKDLLLACAESMRRRDDPKVARRDGILKHDSDRCGRDGAEITTYDSLDVSLGQARNNLYLAVKTLGAWILLQEAFARLGSREHARAAASTADVLAASIVARFDEEAQCFPAVFEHGNRSRIIPAVEGFAYPLFLDIVSATDREGRFGVLLERLERHLRTVMVRGVCLDDTSGAWKMSSTSTNTWFSKIALSQYVVRSLFADTLGAEARAADAVHALWQRRPGCGANAMCDQIHSDTGVSCGSRYYPRGVTAYLWLRESGVAGKR
ncbi:hypothetical protein ASA1KI_24700 [Opitutales bacterium ASA1]|uniref:glycoside hydrolase family 52 protein n=1 Tax=Congregicoccus parvus TaxID=3081749 RepID=UPI002B2CCB38|nr:hypothetical protein ASA1KI_24700 [Opitutales bacterium ASA1]